jgi:hypothetical protein
VLESPALISFSIRRYRPHAITLIPGAHRPGLVKISWFFEVVEERFVRLGLVKQQQVRLLVGQALDLRATEVVWPTPGSTSFIAFRLFSWTPAG